MSKAADKSNSSKTTSTLESTVTRMSFATQIRAVSVEWYWRYADWKLGSRS